MPSLYGRRAEVTVQTGSGAATVPAKRWTFDGTKTGLHIEFDIEQSIESTQNKAKVTLWNLNEASRAALDSQKNPRLILEAGYVDTIAMLFKGHAHHCTSERQDAGWKTTIEALDGTQALSGIVSAALAPGAKPGQVIAKVLDQLGVPAQRAKTRALSGAFDGTIGTYINGFSMLGSAKDVLDRLGRALGFDWYFENGTLEILLPNETAPEEAPLLSPASGLIGSPSHVYDKAKKAVVTKAKSVLNPRLRVGRRLMIQSAELSGVFKIINTKHVGDTHGDSWASEVEAVAVTS